MINYLERTKAYYGAQGYKPYQWAHFEQTPFTPLDKPLSQSRLALITTAAPYLPELGDQGPGAAYNAKAKFFDVLTHNVEPPPDLRISHIGYDRKHCAADDPQTWLPIPALLQAVEDGLIGSFAHRVIGLPTNRSQRITTEQDAPKVLETLRTLGADVALLVPT